MFKTAQVIYKIKCFISVPVSLGIRSNKMRICMSLHKAPHREHTFHREQKKQTRAI